MSGDQQVKCSARAVFWPDAEAIDAVCMRPRGHEPANIHEDEDLGEWNEDDLFTTYPYEQ
ncbi:hypothetical protein ACFV10_28330 [Streptomyces cyaneofuscatus]|uniref:hypothetical protein n=1 Tax=Streptomyces cyaneofuscatus TaxID=66883 RepID=UPI003697874F